MIKVSHIKKAPWYIAGLHFECVQCGNCCAGPEEGYVWISDEEISFAATELSTSNTDFRNQYTRIEHGETSLKEDKQTKDCVFLCNGYCKIYDTRPNQCRTWPFWDINLQTPDDWGWASTRCKGVNRGKLYTYEEIENIRMSRKWWDD